MMDPATIIGIGSTLLGGLFGKPKPKYVVPDYAGIRSKAEAAGFNPLTALTQGPQGSVVDTNAGMGTAIAEAGLMLANNMSKASAASKLQQAQGENAKLRAKVQNLTLRPKVGGIYARRESVPSLGAALGRSNAGAVSSVVAGNKNQPAATGGPLSAELRPLPDVSDADPRRGVDNKPVSTTSGFMVVDQPSLPFPVYFPTADGDEPLQWYDYPSLALPVAGSAVKYAMDNYRKNNAPRPRDPRGVLAGKRPLQPVGSVFGKVPHEISIQQANLMKYGQWGMPHFGPLAKLK